jgi:hypothetical protein
MAVCPLHVCFTPDCVAKLFSRPKRAILIQGQAQTRIIDSKHRSIGFDYCVFAVQQRVLQHNPPNSGHLPDELTRPKSANNGRPFDELARLLSTSIRMFKLIASSPASVDFQNIAKSAS